MTTEPAAQSQLASDIKQALELALTLTELRETAALTHLYFTQRVLKNLKQMPKLKPPAKPLRLSEIAPQIKEEEEVEEEEETEKKKEPRFFARLRRRLRRKAGG